MLTNPRMTKLWKPGAPCSKVVAKHTIYGEHFVIICAQENVGLRTPLSRENMKIQNIINLYAYRSRMSSLENFRGDVNSRDLLHNLNIPSYTLLLRMSTNTHTHTRPHWQTGSHPFHGRPKDKSYRRMLLYVKNQKWSVAKYLQLSGRERERFGLAYL